jgi:hypothetical protein
MNPKMTRALIVILGALVLVGIVASLAAIGTRDNTEAAPEQDHKSYGGLIAIFASLLGATAAAQRRSSAGSDQDEQP